MDFHDILEEVEYKGSGLAYSPYALKIDGKWVEGQISIDWLNTQFGQYSTAEEMKNATESEGLKLYFDWLKEQGILN